MVSQKIMSLAYRVAEMTQEGSLPWKETELEGVFQVSFSSSSVRISTRRSRISNGVEYVFSIINWEGNVVDEVGDEDPDEPNERRDLFEVFKQCYDGARRRALGVDDAIDEILDELRHYPSSR